MPHTKTPNRLINETSPYLLQHAYNPVDWYPWGQEALDLARAESKPILLSIGYSACHWCHVMERESFEDSKIAELMNNLYVCIKVDREERPDLDKIYQLAHQLFSRRSGGWPLTAFLRSEDMLPIFVGTYFPPVSAGGMPGFGELLTNIWVNYDKVREKYAARYQQLKESLAIVSALPDLEINHRQDELPVLGVRSLKEQFDAENGGFSDAPKFPHAIQIAALFRITHLNTATARVRHTAMDMALQCLEAMAKGGLQDHVGGGFYRYAVDEKWEIPHFEKMLYDNAQLMPLYAQASVIADRPDFEEVAMRTAHWVMSEMQSSQGGYFSTVDADSEGEEGKFYVWTVEAIRELLTDEEFDIADACFGLSGTANFEGKWHLREAEDIKTVARKRGLRFDEASAMLNTAKGKLFEHRGSRVPPARDEKILTSWNGLMIAGMAYAGRVLGQPEIIRSAERALSFIQAQMWRDGRLCVVAKDGRVRLNAYLDDYMYVALGVLELLQARWRSSDFAFLIELIETVRNHFMDDDSDAMYFTSNDHEELVARVTPSHDDAMPSGNGVAALLFIRLGYILGDTGYIDVGARILRALQPGIESMPAAFGSALFAITEKVDPGAVVVLRGPPDQLEHWQTSIARHTASCATVLAIPNDAQDLPGELALRSPVGSSTVGYVCRGYVCSAPCDSIEQLIAQVS